MLMPKIPTPVIVIIVTAIADATVEYLKTRKK